MNEKDKADALAHFDVTEDGHLSRCEKCGGFLYAPFLKKKFDEVVADGGYECIVCLRRELISFKAAQKAD